MVVYQMLEQETKIFYKTPDGLLLSAIIALSKEKKRLGSVILAHGLNNNKDEDGNFSKLSRILSSKGYDVLRFDFRAHGESQGKSKDMTIKGELIDFETSAGIFEKLVRGSGKFVIVASSFGASSSILYTSKYPKRVQKLVLWNPVLDYTKTFLKSETPWGKTFFNEKGYREIESIGHVTIPETEFQIGGNLVKEFKKIKPYKLLSKVKIPVLTIHGTQDTAVPYHVSKEYGTPNRLSRFISLDTEHTFPSMENKVIAETVNWITKKK